MLRSFQSLARLGLLFFFASGSLAQNVTQGKPVVASGPTWPGYPATNINDGSVTTFSHPQSATPAGFYYQIDMGQIQALHHISVINRSDGCCTDRLSNYRVALYAEGAAGPGVVLWEAVVRANGTNSGIGGVDVIYPGNSTNPAHEFRGRYLRISNGVGGAYNPQLSELQGWVAEPTTNLAFGRPVVASGAVYTGLDPARLTDGLAVGTNTVSHPADGATLGFYYQVDLGASFGLSRIHLMNRTDCCADRLTNYRVSVLADNNATVNWQATVRGDGTNSGLGGIDQVVKTASTNPAHTFRGRFIRIENLSGAPYNPQLAEVEAYPEPPPTVSYFLTTAGNIAGPGLPTGATLSWEVLHADSVTISGLGPVAATGQQAVTPAATTTYTLTATRAGDASITKQITLAVNAVAQQPRINEFQAADGTLEDEDGDRPDWLEIYNPNAYTLNLQGYSLTDAAAFPAKWTLPQVNVAPQGYLVVYASSKDRAVRGGQLHTNFSLAASGEYVGLAAPGGSVVSQIPATFPTPMVYPRQVDRSSYGLDATGQERYFRPATPGAINGSGSTGVVADTVFSVKRGIYTVPQSVAITTPTPGATIRYTTNGSAPTDSSGTVYTVPLSVSSTTVLRAAAFLAGSLPTNVDTHTYLFPADVPTQATMAATGGAIVQGLGELPSISVVTPASITQDNAVLCSFEYLPTTGGGVPAQENAGVELYGGEFTDFAKKNFRVSFKADFGATSIILPTLFRTSANGWIPVSKFGQLELRGGSHDQIQRGISMSNAFTDSSMADMGAFSVHTQFVHLYLNGTYWGLYQARERWNAEHHTAYYGGPKAAHESINGNYNVGGWADPGDVYDGDGSAWLRVKALRNDFSAIRPYLDTTQYVDYMTMWMFGNSEDEYRTTGPADVGSGLKFFLNDSDGYLMPNPIDGNPNNTLRTASPPGRQAGDGPASLLSSLYSAADPNFRILLADRIHRALFGQGALTPAANAQRLNALCAEVNNSIYADYARWSTTGQNRSYGSWLTEKNNVLQNFLPNRTALYLGHLKATGYYPTLVAPVFAGGAVAPGTSISFASAYYTTDGTDPRLPTGQPSPTAQLGTSTLISQNTWLRARALNAGTWSALHEAYYETTPLTAGDVVIGEIHYNAQGDDDTEFLELWNPTTHAVNLRGVKFTAGLQFNFTQLRDVPLAPGGRLVLVSSLYAFQQRYGLNVPVAGVYQDRLGNDGDTITLSTASGSPLLSLHYTDMAPWPTGADGLGYSLTLADAAQPTLPLGWRTSTLLNGTPGTAETSSLPPGSLLADVDRDGLSTLAEWMLGTAPEQPNACPVAVATDTEGARTLTFPRRLNADSVKILVECSPDLQNWLPLAARTQQVNLGTGFAQETWELPISADREFFRVRFHPQ